MRQGLWGIVSGRSKRPIPADSKATTAAETALIDAWDKNAEKAAGELYLLVSEEQKVHFAGITDHPCWRVYISRCVQERNSTLMHTCPHGQSGPHNAGNQETA